MDHQDALHYEDQVAEKARAAGVSLNVGTFALALNLVRAANSLVAQLEQEVYRHRGVSYAGFRILFALWVVGPAEPRRLATLASVTRSSTSSVLNTLERDGFVERRRESADRRVVTTQLTDSGLKLVLETLEEHQPLLGNWTEGLSEDDRRTMNDLLHRLMASGAPVLR
ncbi:MarR family winged helix-turn-helix transcriptional regulator [Sinomonas atrocyanea]